MVLAPNGAPEAVVVFMHGFSQYPLAYWETLRELALSCNAIVAGTHRHSPALLTQRRTREVYRITGYSGVASLPTSVSPTAT